MYHRQQNKCYLKRCQIVKKLQLTAALLTAVTNLTFVIMGK